MSDQGAPRPPAEDPNCTCKKMRKTTTESDGRIVPHWADLDRYCPRHGTRQAVPHDMVRFPRALDSYACDPCRHGDHVGCSHEIRLPDWSHPCSCYQASLDEHVASARLAKREALAEAIYAEGADQHDFWLTTIDGTPNSASYAIADALIEKRLAR